MSTCKPGSAVFVFLICFAVGAEVATAQDGNAVPLGDSVRHSSERATAHKVHVITNEDLVPKGEQSVTTTDASSAKADAQTPDNSTRAKKPRAGNEPPQYSAQELREQQTFLIQQIASLREQIADGAVDARRDILVHVLEYRSQRLETVRSLLEEAEQRQRSAAATADRASKGKSAKSDKTVSAGTNLQSEAESAQH